MANLPLVDQAQNPSSPYYLHLGENPDMILVSPPMNSTNYHSWSRAMKRALQSKNKLKFINGGIEPPNHADPLFDAWERCNTMVISWITRTLIPPIAQSTIYIDSARDLWDDLKERFSKGDHFRISDLLQDIHFIKQGERNISTFYTDLKILWEELESLRLIPSCICAVPCTCSMFQTIKQHKESEYVMCFLKGLGDAYGTVRTQILLMEPLPSINKVFSMVLQQERQLIGTILGKFNILFNSSNANGNSGWKPPQGRGPNKGNDKGRGKFQGKGGKVCTHCNKTNHAIDQCYYLHGFPPGYKSRNNNSATNVISAATADSHVTNMDTQPTSNQQVPNPFTPTQIQQLLQLLNQPKTQSNDPHVNHITTSFAGESSTSLQEPRNSGYQFFEDDWTC